jgi:hypothetical protein
MDSRIRWFNYRSSPRYRTADKNSNPFRSALNEDSPMRASHLFMIALLGCILYVLLSGRGQTEEGDGNADGLQAAKAYVPSGAGMEWTEEGNLTFSLRFPSGSHAPKRSHKPDANASEREKALSDPYSRVPD